VKVIRKMVKAQVISERFIHLPVGEGELGGQLFREFAQNLSACHGSDLAGASKFHAPKWIAAPARGGKEDVRVENDRDRHGSRLVQKAVDQSLAASVIQRVPIQTPLSCALAQLFFRVSHTCVAPQRLARAPAAPRASWRKAVARSGRVPARQLIPGRS
jgi:hypothetical protein